MGKKNLTIRSIAKMANVSHMTVSRVLNDNPHVKDETKKRILQLVRNLKFRPDPKARNLANKRSFLIGLIVSDIRNPFYAELARGIEDTAREKGYSILFCSTDDQPKGVEHYVHKMLDAGIEGLIFASARLQEPVVEELIKDQFPLVLANRKLKGEDYNYVVLDNVSGAYELTKHLINNGYRKIALLNGPSDLSTGLDRLEGYQKALIDHQIKPDPQYVFQGPFTSKTGYEGAKHFLAMKKRPEAIFAGNDYIAMGAIDAIEEAQMLIPDDIALVGFDDTQFAANRRINLTTVSQRKYKMGSLSVQILINYMERKVVDYIYKVVMEPRLVIRKTCGYQTVKKGLKSESKIK